MGEVGFLTFDSKEKLLQFFNSIIGHVDVMERLKSWRFTGDEVRYVFRCEDVCLVDMKVMCGNGIIQLKLLR